MRNNWKCALAFTGALLVGPAMHSQEECSTEIKFQLSPPALQTVIAALSFENEKAGQVDFFDTENRDLLKSGLIVRVRRGRLERPYLESARACGGHATGRDF